jgi:hypothetical protein
MLSLRRLDLLVTRHEASKPVKIDINKAKMRAQKPNVSGNQQPPVQAASSEVPEHKLETQRVLSLVLPSETYGT